MKKLVTALALCASFSAFAQVESANIVGYETKTLTKATFYAIGNQFQKVQDPTAVYAISNLVVTVNPKTGTSLNNNVDQIHVWGGSSWVKYYNYTGVGYVKDGQITETTDTLPPGAGYFFRKGNDLTKNGSATFSGQVSQSNQVVRTITKATFVFMTNPWPSTLSIAAFTTALTNPKTGTTLNNNVDQVHLWTGSSWTKYYNYTGVGYVKDGQITETTDMIPVGAGFFIRKGNDLTKNGVLTLNSPI